MDQAVRRRLLLAAAGLIAARVNLGRASPLPRIVVLSLSAPVEQMLAFEEGLRALGLIHGSTVELTHRTALGKEDRLTRVAREAVALSPNVIVAVGTKAAVAARNSTKELPIVAVTGDMESAGLVKNFARPESNVTGFSFFTVGLTAKRLELLLEVNPSLRRLTILVPGRRHRTHSKALSLLAERLEEKGIRGEVVGVQHFDDVEAIISTVASSQEEGLLILPSVQFDAQARQIGSMIAKHKVIAMLPWKEYVEAGGLMSYAPDIISIWRNAGRYVDRILKGAAPGELPVEHPRKFDLVVNLKAAKSLGLAIPPSILLRADRVIE